MLIGVDAGTTAIKAVAVDESGAVRGLASRGVGISYPKPGWVEQDPEEILAALKGVLSELGSQVGRHAVALGLANQRETVVAWDRRDGRPLGPAIVWQDRRGLALCRDPKVKLMEAEVRKVTGLYLDPYFSATKIAWLLQHNPLLQAPEVVVSTLDAWLAYMLTGPEGQVAFTEPSNASRTLLFNHLSRTWSEELTELFGIPSSVLPEIRPSVGRFGIVDLGDLGRVPLAALVGDQQASLFGLGCRDLGATKCTYGTGAFVLSCAGASLPEPPGGLLATVAWDLGEQGGLNYALEGSVYDCGSAVDWACRALGIASSGAELAELAGSVSETGGLRFVPALNGLASPWWDPTARGVMVGLEPGVGRAQIARSVFEGIAAQVALIGRAMSGALGAPLAGLVADGGVSRADVLLQLQADLCQLEVRRAPHADATAVGAAELAGIGAGIYHSVGEVPSQLEPTAKWEPRISKDAAESRLQAWEDAVQRARNWARDADVDH